MLARHARASRLAHRPLDPAGVHEFVDESARHEAHEDPEPGLLQQAGGQQRHLAKDLHQARPCRRGHSDHPARRSRAPSWANAVLNWASSSCIRSAGHMSRPPDWHCEAAFNRAFVRIIERCSWSNRGRRIGVGAHDLAQLLAMRLDIALEFGSVRMLPWLPSRGPQIARSTRAPPAASAWPGPPRNPWQHAGRCRDHDPSAPSDAPQAGGPGKHAAPMPARSAIRFRTGDGRNDAHPPPHTRRRPCRPCSSRRASRPPPRACSRGSRRSSRCSSCPCACGSACTRR